MIWKNWRIYAQYISTKEFEDGIFNFDRHSIEDNIRLIKEFQKKTPKSYILAY